MNDTEQSPHKEPFDPSIRIVAACRNGNGRSKEIARALRELGYESALTMGVFRFPPEDEDFLPFLRSAEVIVCAAPDVEADLRAMWARYKDVLSLPEMPKTIMIGIPETMHGELHILLKLSFTGPEVTGRAREIRDSIKNELVKHGFGDFSGKGENT